MLIAAIVIVLQTATYEEALTSGGVDLTPRMAMPEAGLPPHGNESDYPSTSAQDNIVQMVTGGMSRGYVSVSGPNAGKPYLCGEANLGSA